MLPDIAPRSISQIWGKDLQIVTAPDWPWGDFVESKLMSGLLASEASIWRVVWPGARNGERTYWVWLNTNCRMWLPVFFGVYRKRGVAAAQQGRW